jgi:lipid II:glycine glycyltransferase (peptidoglycan interpeptide bridge formation enzyme)
MRVTKVSADFLHLLPATGLPEYLQSFNGCVDYGYIIEGNCILPYLKRKRLFFYFIQLSTGVLGAENEDQEKIFLDNALQFFKNTIRADYIISTNTSIFNSYPKGSLYCKFGSYLLDLEKPEDMLFLGLHSKHRNVIRKAEKEGLVVLYGKEYLVDCYNLINETFSRQGMLSPTIEHIRRLSNLNESISFTIVKFGNEIHGCAIFLSNKNHSCYYLYGGSVKHPHSGAMNLLHWQAILRMKKNGVKYYDFVGGRINPEEGSRLEGIQRFKLRFGGEFVIGYLWKYTFNNFKYKLYSILLLGYFKFIRGEKHEGDVIDQERKRGNF